ncbi:MAG: hypothetical protein HFJ53_07570 [Clostridia bacterium]|nr:hypothetical protein [Clostridia bacterium]
MKKEIGHIILKGGSIQDLQNVLPDFPSNPTREDFIKLGYKEATAKRYCCLLKKQSNTTVENNTSIGKNYNTNIIQTSNANYDNILVDTCALGYKEGIDIIEDAKQVTFIFSTLEEMDRTVKKRNVGRVLVQNIRKYTKKILTLPDKYMISKFSGYSKNGYVDNILLQYLDILPKKIRPTLLTADGNVIDKSMGFDFEYIFINQNTENNKEGWKFLKTLPYGIRLYKMDDEFYICYRGTDKLEICKEGKILVYEEKGVFFKVKPGACLYLYQKIKSNIFKREIKI